MCLFLFAMFCSILRYIDHYFVDLLNITLHGCFWVKNFLARPGLRCSNPGRIGGDALVEIDVLGVMRE